MLKVWLSSEKFLLTLNLMPTRLKGAGTRSCLPLCCISCSFNTWRFVVFSPFSLRQDWSCVTLQGLFCCVFSPHKAENVSSRWRLCAADRPVYHPVLWLYMHNVLWSCVAEISNNIPERDVVCVSLMEASQITHPCAVTTIRWFLFSLNLHLEFQKEFLILTHRTTAQFSSLPQSISKQLQRLCVFKLPVVDAERQTVLTDSGFQRCSWVHAAV